MTSQPIDDLLKTSPHLCPTPIDLDFYEEIANGLPTAPVKNEHLLDSFSGLALDVPKGAAISISLVEGPQIVNLFAYNPADPDERMWQQSVLREGIFQSRFSRLWGTMARYRPLLTVLEDTVSADPHLPRARHHPYFGGSGTPADWRAAGGAEGVPSTWEQFAGLLAQRNVPAHILRENLCLFQRSIIDPDAMRLEILPSNAVAGDRVTLFAEIDLCLLLGLSPFIDGARPASEPGMPQPRAVKISVTQPLAEPLAWPYPEIRYPDLSLYLDETGTRSTAVGITGGIDYKVTQR